MGRAAESHALFKLDSAIISSLKHDDINSITPNCRLCFFLSSRKSFTLLDLLSLKILVEFTLQKRPRLPFIIIIIVGAIIIITKLAIFKYDTIHHLMPATCSYTLSSLDVIILRDVSQSILILFRFCDFSCLHASFHV